MMGPRRNLDVLALMMLAGAGASVDFRPGWARSGPLSGPNGEARKEKRAKAKAKREARKRGRG